MNTKPDYSPALWQWELHVDEWTLWGKRKEIDNKIILYRVLTISEGVLPMKPDRDLIQAAPDLLEALSELVTLAEKQLDQSATVDGLTNCEALGKAREALRLATKGIA